MANPARPDQPRTKRLEVLGTDDPRTFLLVGELDLGTVGMLGTALKRTAREPGDLTLDLSGLDLLDSTGIGVFIETAHALAGTGSLILRRPCLSVARMLELAGVSQLPHLEVVDVAPALRPQRARRVPPIPPRVSVDNRSRRFYAIER